MNEVKRKALLNKIDEDWLALAYELAYDEVPAGGLRKGAMLEELLDLRRTEPFMLLFPLHQGILSLFLNYIGDKIGTEISELELARIRRNILKDLREVNDDDYVFHVPNDALTSSAAFAEILMDEKVLPEFMLEWSDVVDEAMGYVTFSMEMWNLINYYGAITMEDLTRVHAEIYGEEEPVPENVMAAVLLYIQMNLSEDTYFDTVDGVDWFMTEYGDIDPHEIIEDIKVLEDLDYQILNRETLMSMIHGILPYEMLKVYDWLATAYKLDDAGEELIGDINFLHGIIMDMRSRHGENVPEFLHELLGLEWEVSDPEARDLIYQELLHHIARFHLKGHSQAQLDGDEEEDPFYDLDGEDDDELFFEDDMPEEYNFRLRKKNDDDENYLN